MNCIDMRISFSRDINMFIVFVNPDEFPSLYKARLRNKAIHKLLLSADSVTM